MGRVITWRCDLCGCESGDRHPLLAFADLPPKGWLTMSLDAGALQIGPALTRVICPPCQAPLVPILKIGKPAREPSDG